MLAKLWLWLTRPTYRQLIEAAAAELHRQRTERLVRRRINEAVQADLNAVYFKQQEDG